MVYVVDDGFFKDGNSEYIKELLLSLSKFQDISNENIKSSLLVHCSDQNQTFDTKEIFGSSYKLLDAKSNFMFEEFVNGLVFDRSSINFDSTLTDRLEIIYGQSESPALTAFISSDEKWFESLKDVSMNFKRQKSSWMVAIGPESDEVSRTATSSNEAIILQVIMDFHVTIFE